MARQAVVSSLVAMMAASIGQAAAAPADLDHALRAARTNLVLAHGHLSGAGAAVLTAAIAQSRIVAIGEDHLTREIPHFTAAICDAMAPGGLDAMAVETGPQVTALLAPFLGRGGAAAAVAAHIHQYPDSVAFLNMRDEVDLADHCARAAGPAHFHLFGLDQEFIGAGVWLLDLVLAEPLSPAAAAEIGKLRAEAQRDAEDAARTGDPQSLFMLRAPPAALAAGTQALQAGGTERARALFRALVKSHDIYATAHTPESNRARGVLLRQTLLQDLGTLPDHGTPPRLLLKFGDNHMFKGFNPIHQRDLGNFVAELADGQGVRSLHIEIVGVSGVHRLYGGYTRPTKLEPFAAKDPDQAWLQPATDQRFADGWTLFDLRAVRFQKLGEVGEDWRRMLDGYDFLLVIPVLSPAEPL